LHRAIATPPLGPRFHDLDMCGFVRRADVNFLVAGD
jgi:hypothetical protein